MADVTTTLLRTKLHRPPVTRDLVSRPYLLKQLNRRLDRNLTLVSAPAGFGKTTLISSWLDAVSGDCRPPLPATWLSLDEHDSDLTVFLHYLVAAVRLLFTDACAETLELLQARHPPPPATLVTTFINEIVRLPRFILVLDDYHTLGGNAVHDLLGQLLGHWPQSLHLVLISRHPPPLPLAELRARGSMVEIRRDDLRFTEAESGAYLARALDRPLNQPALALLEQRTEGWIAGLHLAALALRDAGDTEAVLNALAAADTNISAYLVDGVLALQSPAIHAFLLQTCILDRFCVPLCEAVIGASGCDVPACINWLEDANLFVTALDDRRKWYRYHPLFQNLLQRRALAEWGLEAVTDRHRRAAAWFDRQALLDEALRHALAAGDLDYAARLMEQGLCAVLNREDRSTLERWLGLLPEEFIQRRPGLLMIRAWVLQLTWQLGAQMRVLRQVEALLNADAGAVLPADEDVRAGGVFQQSAGALHRRL